MIFDVRKFWKFNVVVLVPRAEFRIWSGNECVYLFGQVSVFFIQEQSNMVWEQKALRLSAGRMHNKKQIVVIRTIYRVLIDRLLVDLDLLGELHQWHLRFSWRSLSSFGNHCGQMVVSLWFIQLSQRRCIKLKTCFYEKGGSSCMGSCLCTWEVLLSLHDNHRICR